MPSQTVNQPSERSLTQPRLFYGWWVLCGCFLLQLASAPGHTFGVNAFVESWIRELGLTRTQVSTNWFLASTTSAAMGH